MKSSVASVCLGLFGLVAAQGVVENIFPPGESPAGCKKSVDGQFEITVVESSVVSREEHRLGHEKRQECGKDGVLVLTLKDSVTKDALSRTGYVASNFQFQFDAPAQAGALFTAGFSLCDNGLLALGNTTEFFKCKSGDFYNLYDRHWAAQCEPVALKALPCGAGAEANPAGGQQVVGTNVITTTIVRPIGDGQPQVITTVVPVQMCQIGDGQIQAHSTPCASVQVPDNTAPPVSQITDGQIQVPPPAGTGGSPPQPPAGAVPTTPAGVFPPGHGNTPIGSGGVYPPGPTGRPNVPGGGSNPSAPAGGANPPASPSTTRPAGSASSKAGLEFASLLVALFAAVALI